MWTLLSAKEMFAGNDVPRPFEQTLDCFLQSLSSRTFCRALPFRPLIFRGLLCEPEAKSHFLAKCGLIFKACLLGKIEVCRFDIVQAEKRIWFFP